MSLELTVLKITDRIGIIKYSNAKNGKLFHGVAIEIKF